MTSRERLGAVLGRRTPDTVPIYIRGVNPFGERMNWMGKHDPSYERLRRFVLENTDIFLGCGFDGGVFLSAAGVKVTRGVIREDDDWRDYEELIETPLGPIRSLTRISKHGYFDNMVEYFIKDATDYERFMSIPYAPCRPPVKEAMELADRQAGVHGLPAVSIPCALMYVHQLFGSEALALWSKLDRDRLTRVFDLLKARVLDYVEYILREGAGPVLSYGGPELAVPPLMTPKDFHDFVTVMDKPVHEMAHSYGRYTWVHCHGTLDKVLEEFFEIGVDVLEPLEAPPGGDVELADAKRRIGDRIVIMGNMPYEAIISWPKDRIEERVKSDCEAAMAGGGYIMMPCASPFETVLTDEAFEGFKAYILAGRKYGKYGRSS